MKILHFDYGFEYPPIGGEQERVSQELTYLSKNCDILLAYPDFSPNARVFRDIDPQKIPFQIKKFPLGTIKDGNGARIKEIFHPVRRKQLKSIQNLIEEFSPDLIHHHFGAMNRMAESISAGKKMNIVQVATLHVSWPFCIYGTHFNYQKKSFCVGKRMCSQCMTSRSKMLSKAISYIYSHTIVRKVLNSIDHYVCYTPYHQYILESVGIETSRVSVLPPGIHPLSRIAVNDFSDRKYIVYSGRFSEEKGVYLFLEVARRFKDSDVDFLMIGDGYLKDELQKLTREESLRIRFVDWIKDRNKYKAYINQAKMLIVPSLWPETFGMVILDAFQCGTPVIGTSMGGIPYIIENNKNGFVVTPDPDVFTEKIKILLDDSSLWQKFSHGGLERAAKVLSWEENATHLQHMYSSILRQ